jgi:hypothetical protein
MLVVFLPSLLFLSATSSSRLMTFCFVTNGAIHGFSTGILFLSHVLPPDFNRKWYPLQNKPVVQARTPFSYLSARLAQHPRFQRLELLQHLRANGVLRNQSSR